MSQDKRMKQVKLPHITDQQLVELTAARKARHGSDKSAPNKQSIVADLIATAHAKECL